MRIAAIIVTWNRVSLLKRALESVRIQKRRPDSIIVVSNSQEKNHEEEDKICKEHDANFLVNKRTNNTSGAINSAIQTIVQSEEFNDDFYIALLDDDDEWLPEYLYTLEINNQNMYDVMLAELSRNNGEFDNHQILPDDLSLEHLLEGNPGIGNSNTFVKLSMVLMAGCYDEFCQSNIDRDFFIRLFQLSPKHKIIHNRLVISYTDNDRPRITNNVQLRERNLRYLYYKYSGLMSESSKGRLFHWTKSLFDIDREKIEYIDELGNELYRNEIVFNHKEKRQPLIIGFITDDDQASSNLIKNIRKKIPIDALVIINSTNNAQILSKTTESLNETTFAYEIVDATIWEKSLQDGTYGDYFKKFKRIDSIPLGRTILHHHLYNVSQNYDSPAIWIIDDDVDFSNISLTKEEFNFFGFINEYSSKTDVVIGGISSDPPIPALSCIRTQLVDFLYNSSASLPQNADFSMEDKTDYYYDLSSLRSDHLEHPISSNKTQSEHIHTIFSGKSVSRPAIQGDCSAFVLTLTKRGGNTIVFDREVLRNFPVINLEYESKLARRGDLTWAIFNQLVSGKKIADHGFCLNHQRVRSNFEISRELEKSASDIVGYAFNKALMDVIKLIFDDKDCDHSTVLTNLTDHNYLIILRNSYTTHLKHRLASFIMNYYRIIGLTKLITEIQPEAQVYYIQLKDIEQLNLFKSKIPFQLSLENVICLFLELQNRPESRRIQP